MRVVDIFVQQCQQHPQVRALQVWNNGQLNDFTWAELESLTIQTIGLLQSRVGNLKVGDHVATCLGNGLAWILVDLAAQWMGWVHVAFDPRLPHKIVDDLLVHSCSRLLISDSSLAHPYDGLPVRRPNNVGLPHHRASDEGATVARQSDEALSIPGQSDDGLEVRRTGETPVVFAHEIERLPTKWRSERVTAPAPTDWPIVSEPIAADAPAQLLYTSGTIGRPKGALLSHRNLLSNAQAKLLAAPQHATDVRLNILPLAHAYARTCELSTWILSGSQLCIASDWSKFLQCAQVVQPTLVNLVPHLVYRLVDRLNERAEPFPLGTRLRLLQVGGAALREDVWQRLASLGYPPLQGYGLTETSPVICSNRAGQQRMESVGPPVAGVEIRIDDDGVLWTRGPHVMLGYWRDTSATSARIRDGWFCTGDLAEQMADGSLRIIGRQDDQITLTTGYKVSPLELTRRLSGDSDIEQLVLVGNNRPHITALVYPRSKPMDQAAFIGTLIARWQPLTCDLPRYMHIEKVALLKEPLTIENGGINFKGAVRRAYIEANLQNFLSVHSWSDVTEA